MQEARPRKGLWVFFVLIASAAVGNGLSDAIYSNFYKDAYNISAVQRAFIEFPRETPGLLCALVIASLSMLGDVRTALIAQVLALFGLTVLGLFTPSFGVMLIFLFINSMGMHLFMPLQDSIGMAMAEPGQVGKRMGQYASVKTAMAFLAGLIVFFGFRSGVFSLKTQVKTVFLLGAGAFAVAIAAAIVLSRLVSPGQGRRPVVKPVFRKEYKYYYFLTVLNGVQKQIAYVFGSWVVVDLLAKGADVMSLLLIAASFLGMFFMRFVGHWLDRFGIKRMMYADALSFICVYIVYGLAVWGISSGVLPRQGWPALFIYCLFVSDRLSMQLGVVKSLYLRSIAVNEKEITAALSTGISLDHLVAIIAAQLSGAVWTFWGPQWVFFIAAFLSFGNLFVAWRLPGKNRETEPEAAAAEA